MALALRLTGPGEWALSRNNVETGKLRRAGGSVIFVLFDRNHTLSTHEKEELDKLARELVVSPFLGAHHEQPAA